MNENTFRAVVAAVLVGALALAIVVVAAILVPRRSEPQPSPTRPAPTPAPSITLAPVAGPVFEAPDVVGVGLISRGSSSAPDLEFEFVESSDDAILNAPGSFRVTITDHAGDASSVAFAGTPLVAAPGSLGVTVALVAPNALLVQIVASDPTEIEPITITGLGIKVSSTAAIGPVAAEAGAFSGSLAGGLATQALASPASVIAPR